MPGKAVAEVEPAQVPDLVRTQSAARTITADDVKWPRLYIAQKAHKAVENDLAKTGDFFVALDKDDTDPVILAKRGDAKGVYVHVLDMVKGISRSDGGQLETWAYDDPTAPRPGPATGAWISYTYFLAIPSYDKDIAVRFILSRSGRGAAQKINTVRLRAQGSTPPYELAFKLTSEPRENDKGSWYQALVTPVDATDEGIEIARELYALVEEHQESAQAAATEADGDPSI